MSLPEQSGSGEELSFHDFGSSLAGSGDAAVDIGSSSSASLSSANAVNLNEPQRLLGEDSDEAARRQRRESRANASMFSIAFYQDFFDVDTATILRRLQHATLPRGALFYQDPAGDLTELEGLGAAPASGIAAAAASARGAAAAAGGNGSATLACDAHGVPVDLYAPFWIATTLIFLVASTGNFASYLASTADVAWEYDLNTVSVGATVLYAFLSVVPLATWYLLDKVPVALHRARSLVEIISLYGYSLVLFVPTAVLCIVPLNFLRWIFCSAAAAHSAYFLLRNLIRFDDMDTPTKRAHLPVLACLGGAQIGLGLFLKLYFFHY